MLPISRRIKDKVHQGGKRNSATLAMASRAQGTLALKRVLPLFYNLLPLYNLKCVLPLLYNLDLGTFALKLVPPADTCVVSTILLNGVFRCASIS